MVYEEMQQRGVWVRKRRIRGGWGDSAVLPWSSPCLLLVVLQLTIHLSTWTVAAQERCSTVCGDIKLSYPFGIEYGCGSSDFQGLLTCSETVLELRTGPYAGSYAVSNIDYDQSAITISMPEYPNLDCSKIDSDGLVWKVVVGGHSPSCSSKFKQDKSGPCKSCEQKPGGVCGYNSTTQNNTCLCSSELNPTDCDSLLSQTGAAAVSPASGQKSTRNKVLSAVGGAGGALLLTLMGFLCFRRWKSWYSSRVKDKEMRNMAQILSAGSPAVSGVTMFTYKELASTTKNFAHDKQLGGGGYNTVYKGRLKDGRLVAVKKLNQANHQGIRQFMAEVTVLSQARHRNLVQLYGCCLEHKDPLLVYEYVANGTLADNLHGGHTNLECTTRLSIAIDVAEALAYLHSLQPPIFHRDVKSTNILLDRNFVAKVGDFGLSRLSEPFRTHVSTAPQGTPGYLDPDYHQTYHLSDKSDVYSLGVVLMELITGKQAVDMSRERGEINLSAMATARIQNGTLDELLDARLELDRGNVKEVAMALGELGFQCLASDKDDRPSMREVVSKLRSIQYLALAIPSPMASPPHPRAQETCVLIKSSSANSVNWTPPESYPDFSHQLVGR